MTDRNRISYRLLCANESAEKLAGDGKANIKFSKVARQVEEENPLAVIHNISLEGLRHAKKIGGLAVPSIAVVNQKHPLTGFGEITLVGDVTHFSPEVSTTNKWYNADVYSPRYPSVTYTVDTKAVNAANDSLSEDTKILAKSMCYRGLIDSDRIEDSGIMDALSNSPTLKFEFLHQLGKAPAFKYKPKKVPPDELKKFVNSKVSIDDLSNLPEFVELIIGRANDKITRLNERRGKNNPLIQPNTPEAETVIRDAQYEVKAFREEKTAAKVIDTLEMSKVIAAKTNQAAYEKWLEKNYSHLVTGERIFNGYTNAGGRKYLPHNLDTVVQLMTKTVKGGEGFNYGIGSIRAQTAKQFKTVKSIKAARADIISDEEMKVLQEEVAREFEAIENAIQDYGNNYSTNDLENALAALAEKGPRAFKEYYENVPADLMSKIYAFLDKLKNMPTHYFEGKIGRAVQLNEFSAALVPAGKEYDEAVELLKKAGLTDVKRYKKDDPQGRSKALLSFKGLLFSYAGKNAKNADISALERAVKMEQQGVDADTIRKETGWFLGFDDHWKFEVSDDNVTIKKPFSTKGALFGDVFKDVFKQKVAGGQIGLKVRDIINAPNLFSAYPELEDISISDTSSSSSYNTKDKLLSIGRDIPMSDVKSTVLHELQHAIQDIEGFAKGGSPEQFEGMKFSDSVRRELLDETAVKKRVAEYYKKAESNGTTAKIEYESEIDANGFEIGSEKDNARIRELIDAFDSYDEANRYYLEAKEQSDTATNPKLAAHQKYLRLAGEIEARDTESRLHLTDAQRKGLTPYIAQGISKEDAIVHFKSGVANRETVPTETHTNKSFLDSARSKLNAKFGKSWFDRLWKTGNFVTLSNDAAEQMVGEYAKMSVRPSDDLRKWDYRSEEWLSSTKGNSRLLSTKNGISIYLNESKAQLFDEQEEYCDVYAVDSDGKVVGFTAFIRNIEGDGRLEGHPEVHPDFRRRGIATQMFDAYESDKGEATRPVEGQSDEATKFWLNRLEPKYSKDGKIEAFYNPADNKVYFIPENISQDVDLVYLFLHEVGVHMRQMGENKKGFEAILREVEELVLRRNPHALEGRRRAVAADTREEDLNEETLAYMLQNAPKLNVVQKFGAWYRKGLRNWGLTHFKGEDKKFWLSWESKLTVNDISYMTESALKRTPTKIVPDKVPLAPNNEPSKLTPAQWTQVRTPEFKQWFGDWENDPDNASVVVDENGEPLVVYTAFKTAKTFEKADMLRLGAFFTPSRKIAMTYFGDDIPKVVVPAFLNIRQPKVLRKPLPSVSKVPTPKSLQKKIQVAEQKGYGGGVYKAEEDLRQLTMKLDVDGVLLEKTYYPSDKPRADQWVVFFPNQVKSATKNRGTFNAKSDSVYASTSSLDRDRIAYRIAASLD